MTTCAIEIDLEPGPCGRDSTATEWSELADRLDAPPFLRPHWFQLWWDAFGRGRPGVVTARAAGGSLVGVLPVRAGVGMLASPSNDHSPMFDAVAATDSVHHALWRWAIERAPRRLSAQVGAAGRQRLRQAASQAGWHPWDRSTYDVPAVDLASTTWEHYSAGLTKNLRRRVRRGRARLEADAPVQLELLRGRDAVAGFETALEIEASGWKGGAGTAIASQPHTRRFYSGLVRWGAAEGWLVLAMLRSGSRSVAFELIVEHDRCWYPVKAGYDAALAKASPGVVALWDVLEAAFAGGIRRYDFTGEQQAYMDSWATDTATFHRVEVFHPCFGVPDRLVLAVARPLAKQVRDLGRRGAAAGRGRLGHRTPTPGGAR